MSGERIYDFIVVGSPFQTFGAATVREIMFTEIYFSSGNRKLQ